MNLQTKTCAEDFDIVESNPSEVIDVSSDDYLEQEAQIAWHKYVQAQEEHKHVIGNFPFDEEKGYIVDGEDPALLAALGIPVHSVPTAKPRPKTEADVDRERLAQMSPAERDLERFDWI